MSKTNTGAAVTVGMKLHFNGDRSNDPGDFMVETIDARNSMVYIVAVRRVPAKGMWIPAGLPFTPGWSVES